ncbi:MAG: hypothetical protein WD333_02180 [Dehalococcoidia bacterium]
MSFTISGTTKWYVATGFVAIAAVVGVALVTALGGGTAEAAGDNKVTHSNVYRFADGSEVESAKATLVRSKSGVTTTLNTDQLDANTGYTMWWVIFNDPRECENPIPGLTTCGESDLLLFGGKPEINSSVLFAAGNVVGGTGLVSFGAYLEEGVLPTGNGQVTWGPGLVDAKRAEIHLVVRSHGPVVPDIEEAQISSFGGGCTEETDPSGTGPAGSFACVDHQFAVFVPHKLK